jgi:hypothetical protein
MRGAAAVVAGGFDDSEPAPAVGRDLGVAITGSEELGITLVLTEGFGHIRMRSAPGSCSATTAVRSASVSGATQIRAGVKRPEIIVPQPPGAAHLAVADTATGLDVGSLLRVIRPPYFGRIGRALELPPELRALDSEAQCACSASSSRTTAAARTVPRANVELIAE